MEGFILHLKYKTAEVDGVLLNEVSMMLAGKDKNPKLF